MENQEVIYKKEGGIATIVLNRPDKMNAFVPGIIDGIYRSVEDASVDEEIKVLVLTGAGKAFCSGADIKAMAATASNPDRPKKKVETPAPRIHLPLLLQQCEKPIIAAINGAAIGGGLDLALACDIRIASDRARLSEAYIRRGFAPAGGGAYILPRLIGLDRACQLIFTGDMIDAEKAKRLGMVTMVVPHNELESTAMALAEKIARGPLLALRYAKRAIYEGLSTDFKTSLELTEAMRRELLKTEDTKEGAISFVEKRAPLFKGK